MSMSMNTASELVRSAAQQAGLTLTPEAATAAAARVAASFRYDPDLGNYVAAAASPESVRVVNGIFEDVPPGEIIVGITRQHGKPNTDTSSTGAAKPAYVRTDTMGQMMAAFQAGQRTKDDAELDVMARKIAAGPNPWKAAKPNQTHVAILQRRLPEVAARLKAEAGR